MKIYISRCDYGKFCSILSWINGEYWKTWREKDLMTDDYMLKKSLDKIKMIMSTEKIYDKKMLICTGDNLFDEVILEKVVVLILCAIKD